MDDERTWYEVLGVEPSAAKGDIKAAYQQALDAATVAENGDEVAQVRRALAGAERPGAAPALRRGDRRAHAGALEPVTRNGDGRRRRRRRRRRVRSTTTTTSKCSTTSDGPRVRRPEAVDDGAPPTFLELPTLGRRVGGDDHRRAHVRRPVPSAVARPARRRRPTGSGHRRAHLGRAHGSSASTSCRRSAPARRSASA